MAEASDFGSSGGDHISHPEDRRVIILHVNEVSRVSSSVLIALVAEAKSLGDELQTRRGARCEDNAVLVGARVEMIQDPERENDANQLKVHRETNSRVSLISHRYRVRSIMSCVVELAIEPTECGLA